MCFVYRIFVCEWRRRRNIKKICTKWFPNWWSQLWKDVFVRDINVVEWDSARLLLESVFVVLGLEPEYVWDTETISPKTKLLAPTSSTSLWQCGVVIQSRYNTYLLITDTKMRDYFHTDISRNDCKRVTYCQKVWLLKNFCVALSLCVRDWHELIS